MQPPPDIVLCDLDGVVWLGGVAIPGSVEAIARLRAAGRRVVFVTNDSSSTIAEHVAALGSIGVAAEGDFVSSSAAAAELLQPGERVLVCGGPGIAEAVTAAGATAVAGDDAVGVDAGIDAVVVGFHTEFDYRRLSLATAAIRRGARFVATNRDPLRPMPDGPIPGGGAIVAAVATAAGIDPEVAGKPAAPMARAVRRLLGADGDTELGSRLVVVGDMFLTDGRFAAELGARFALVRTGNTPPGALLERTPDYDGVDFADVAQQLLSGR
jgi:HAD superfamily hydrolase (TIGR01450 family)